MYNINLFNIKKNNNYCPFTNYNSYIKHKENQKVKKKNNIHNVLNKYFNKLV